MSAPASAPPLDVSVGGYRVQGRETGVEIVTPDGDAVLLIGRTTEGRLSPVDAVAGLLAAAGAAVAARADGYRQLTEREHRNRATAEAAPDVAHLNVGGHCVCGADPDAVTWTASVETWGRVPADSRCTACARAAARVSAAAVAAEAERCAALADERVVLAAPVEVQNAARSIAAAIRARGQR